MTINRNDIDIVVADDGCVYLEQGSARGLMQCIAKRSSDLYYSQLKHRSVYRIDNLGHEVVICTPSEVPTGVKVINCAASGLQAGVPLFLGVAPIHEE